MVVIVYGGGGSGVGSGVGSGSSGDDRDGVVDVA